jgi:hypothetical protein
MVGIYPSDFIMGSGCNPYPKIDHEFGQLGSIHQDYLVVNMARIISSILAEVGCRNEYTLLGLTTLQGPSKLLYLAWYRNRCDRIEGVNRVLPDMTLKSTIIGTRRKGALRHFATRTAARAAASSKK